MRTKLRRLIYLTGLLLYSIPVQFFISAPLSAQSDRDILKAAYIERITRFVEWPQVNKTKDTSIFTIGVYGDREFEDVLKIAYGKRTIKGKSVEIKKIVTTEQIESCDICYVSDKMKDIIGNIVTAANNYGVLLMSEAKDFGINGVHFNFYIENDKLRFEINKKSLDSGRFKTSSLLMMNVKIIQ